MSTTTVSSPRAALTHAPVIEPDLLVKWGAVLTRLPKKEIIFREGDQPRFYYQLEEGNVRMYSSTGEGKEITQGIFYPGQSFGEPPLFINETYPAAAVTTTECMVYKLNKQRFIEGLEQSSKLQMDFLKLMAARLHRKANVNKELIIASPQDRLIAFLNWYKKEYKLGTRKAHVHYTRQEIANFTGLCVETVIRTLSHMKDNQIVNIVDRKLYY